MNEHIAPLNQKIWVAGLTCIIVGSVVDFLAFGLAPQSLLAPLAALSLIWNLGMATYMLNEKYDRIDIGAAITIFFGTGLTVSNAPHEEKEYDLDALIELWSMERMMYYLIVIPVLLLLHYIMITLAESSKGLLFKLRLTQKHIGFVRMCGYCGFAGIVGGQSLLFAKSFVELIKSAFNGSDAFWHIETYFILGVLVVCLLVQVSYLNNALKYFDSLYVVPVYQSYWILAGVIGGLVYFGEWDEMSAYDSRLFCFGILITFCGLFILTQKEGNSSTAKSPEKYKDSKKYMGLSVSDDNVV